MKENPKLALKLVDVGGTFDIMNNEIRIWQYRKKLNAFRLAIKLSPYDPQFFEKLEKFIDELV